MKLSRLVPAVLTLPVLLALGALPAFAAATLSQQIDPPEANVGDEVNVTLSIQNGNPGNIELPHVDGLQVASKSTSTNITFTNGTLSSAVAQSFILVPTRAGNFTIPEFDIHLQDGQMLHAHAMSVKIVPSGAPPSNGSASQNGPVTFPPAVPVPPPQDASNGTAPDADATTITPPMESDGRPAKVFVLITPQTTDAYVGQSIPLRIEFFIRDDVLAQQDSLPTIKGSDFLMNDLSLRPGEDDLMLAHEPYHRETWLTALSAPRSGDFPLQMERDTYWSKNSGGLFSDPLGNLFSSQRRLAHANIPSNELVIHVHALPDENRPADFTGAIGQFKAEGNASPTAVDAGDPVYLDFTVSGEGNFDRVRCPSLVPDPAWKTYVPSSKVEFSDESRTQGDKTFHQALIPKKNGELPLPAASFSYFDPAQKKYITIPIPLPAVTVTGNPATAAAPAPSEVDNSASAAAPVPAASADLLANRLEFGALHTDLAPVYRRSWFWLVQAGLLGLLLLSSVFVLLRSRRKRDDIALTRAMRQRSLQELEQAMSDAAQRGDASAFFLAARQAVQLQWGASWGLRPEAVTLSLIAGRDPELAKRLTPLFEQADEVMYSGHATAGIDLADWDRRVREELMQLQPA